LKLSGLLLNSGRLFLLVVDCGSLCTSVAPHKIFVSF
jgi:hypothetical protein